MKKIYLTLLTGFVLGQNLNAQLTLTKSLNDPVIGDQITYVNFDSTAAIPRNTGTNQTWNFSTIVQSTLTSNASTFVAASTSSDAAMFPGATIAEKYGQDSYTFYKSTTGQNEVLGFAFPGGTAQYTNTLIQLKWPTSYGSTYTDTYSGGYTGFFAINVSATFTSLASGTGNLILPGGASYSNILQLRVTETNTATTSVPIATTVITHNVSYIYCHSSSKFPLLTVSYEDGEPSISMNKNVVVGLTDYNFDASFAIYPNPAKNNFNVKLSNTTSNDCIIEIFNATGQLVRQENLGNNSSIQTIVSINDLNAGIYMVKTSLGQKSSVRRLIVE